MDLPKTGRLRVVLSFITCLLVVGVIPRCITRIGHLDVRKIQAETKTHGTKDDTTDQDGPTPRLATTCHSSRLDARNKSSWFLSKLDRNVPVFLNRANRSMKTAAKVWWLSMQANSMSQTDTGLDGIITKLLEVVPGKSSFHEDGKTCISCAIVGNAGNLIGSSYGTIIDSQDVVIRMNRSPTEGYEKDVGSRTTHHILYPESGDGYHRGASLIFLPFKPIDLMWLTGIFTTTNVTGGFKKPVVQTLPEAKPEDVYIIHPDFLHYVETTWVAGHTKRKWPSAGTVALVIGLHVCAEVHVMGFGLDKYGQWDHYYDPQSGFKRTHHLADLEAAVRKQLNEENLISFYPGNHT